MHDIMIMDVNVFNFLKRSFRYENDDEELKTKLSFFKTIVVIKYVVSLMIINDDPWLTSVNDNPSLTIVTDCQQREEERENHPEGHW